MDLAFVSSFDKQFIYPDFGSLVEMSGYRICEPHEMDLESDSIYITPKGDQRFTDHIKERRASIRGPQKAKVVLWYLERPDLGGDVNFVEGFVNRNTEALRYFDAIWVSDRYVQSMDPRLTYAVLGGHPGFAELPRSAQAIYDYTCMANINSRRQGILDQLQDLRMGPNCFGKERARVLASTPLMLYVQRFEAPVFAPLRAVIAAAYGMALVAETCVDPWPLEAGSDLIVADYNHLGVAMRDLLAGGKCELYANNLRRKLIHEWDFRRGVREALNRTGVLVEQFGENLGDVLSPHVDNPVPYKPPTVIFDRTICGTPIKSIKHLDNLLWHRHEIMAKYWGVSDGDVCIDAGFGPGGWTLLALARGAIVHAFDPKPLCVEILTQVMAANAFNRCTIIQKGLWSETGTRPFGVNSFKEPSMESTAPVITLDDYVRESGMDRLDFINMDVEDAEVEVVLGGKETIRRFKPKLVIEFHGEEAVKVLKRELEALGDYQFECFQEFLMAVPK